MYQLSPNLLPKLLEKILRLASSWVSFFYKLIVIPAPEPESINVNLNIGANAVPYPAPYFFFLFYNRRSSLLVKPTSLIYPRYKKKECWTRKKNNALLHFSTEKCLWLLPTPALPKLGRELSSFPCEGRLGWVPARKGLWILRFFGYRLRTTNIYPPHPNPLRAGHYCPW